MALSLSTLQNEFLKLVDPTNPGFRGWPPTVAQAIQSWASAYDTYARAAMDVSGDAVATVNLAGFISALTAGIPESISGSPATAAQAFESAFVAYWTGGIFAVGVPPTGAGACPNIGGNMIFSVEASSVVSVVTPNVLKPLLLSEFSTFSSNGAAKALNLATAFHTATTSAVIVLISGMDTTPPPAGPLPITNTCTIF